MLFKFIGSLEPLQSFIGSIDICLSFFSISSVSNKLLPMVLREQGTPEIEEVELLLRELPRLAVLCAFC